MFIIWFIMLNANYESFSIPIFILQPVSSYFPGIRRFRPLSSSPLQVRPYLIPCSPPHFSSSTPSSRVRPLIEWYPDINSTKVGHQRTLELWRKNMIVFNARLTRVWISFHDKIWYPPLTPLFLCSWNKSKMKFTEIPNVGRINFWRKKRLRPLEINKIVILN